MRSKSNSNLTIPDEKESAASAAVNSQPVSTTRENTSADNSAVVNISPLAAEIAASQDSPAPAVRATASQDSPAPAVEAAAVPALDSTEAAAAATPAASGPRASDDIPPATPDPASPALEAGTAVEAADLVIPINAIASFKAPGVSREEKAKLLASFVVMASTLIMYYETTNKAPNDGVIPGYLVRTSGMSANGVINFWAAYASLDHYITLYRDKKYAELAISSALALGMSVPLVFISIMESTSILRVLIFEALATAMGNASIYGLATKQLSDLYNALRNRFRQDEAVTALEKLSTQLSFTSYQNLIVNFVNRDYMHRYNDLSEYPIHPCLIYMGQAIKMMLSIAVVAALTYGTFGYTCATIFSIQNDFKLQNQIADTIFGNITISLQYSLNAVGGVKLITTGSDIIAGLLTYRKLDNAFKLGGRSGCFATAITPILSAIIAIASGYTSKMLFTTVCPKTLLRSLMGLNPTYFVQVPAVVFNTIYCVMAFAWMITYCVQHFGNSETLQKDRAYLAVMRELNTEIQKLKDAARENARIAAETAQPESTGCLQALKKVWTSFHSGSQRTTDELEQPFLSGEGSNPSMRVIISK